MAEPDDDLVVDGDEAAWYAAAGAGDEEDEVEDVDDDDEGDVALAAGLAAVEDPYLASGGAAAPDVRAPAVASAAVDPYQESAPPTSTATAQPLEQQQQPAAQAAAGPLAGQKRPTVSKLEVGKQEVDGATLPPVKVQRSSASVPGWSAPAPPAPPMPHLPTSGAGAAPGATPVADFGGVAGVEIDIRAEAAALAPKAADGEAPPPMGPPDDFGLPVPDVEDLPDAPLDPEVADGEMSWDERVVVVRQGQVQIELQNRNPPMVDATLLRFCDWLDEQMPLVVSNFPYVRKSGAYVDLSDNVIGPDGLDKLFTVLRNHRVPCVVLKAYRNILDDSIVDTLIEYLYTQPEAFPMHGIHISHNCITDQGALRLIRAAAQCGHYPRLSSRLPLWLRLECNEISNPQQLVADCLRENFNVCLMQDGICSRPDCNHYSGVHVQLPYFFHQYSRKPKGPRGYQRRPPQLAKQPPPLFAAPPALQPAMFKKEDGGLAGGFAEEPMAPDWMRQPPRLLRPAPKKFAGAPTGLAMGLNAGPAPPPPPPSCGMEAGPAPSQAPAPGAFAGLGGAPPSEGFDPTGGGGCGGAGSGAGGGWAGWTDDDSALAGPCGGQPPPPPQQPSFFGGAISGGGGGFGGGAGCGCGGGCCGGGCVGGTGGCFGGGPGGCVGGAGGCFGGGPGGCFGGGPGACFGGGPGAGFGGGPGAGFGGGRGGWGTGGGGGGSWGMDGGKGGGFGGSGGGKGGKGRGKRQMWIGMTLPQKVKLEVKLPEGELALGFQWQYMGDGICPPVVSVDPNSLAAQAAMPGYSLLRVNGLDTSMFSEKQITDMLKQRPITLRFGDQ